MFSSGSMANINGEKVRKLREKNGLTQLYVATVVGVTTDTISRWENRRYPNIKQENAEKLAEALEVSLEEILDDTITPSEPDQEEPSPVGPVFEEKTAQPASRKISWYQWVPVLVAGFVLGFAVWKYIFGNGEHISVTAFRVMPNHIPAGEVFPVIIHVKTQGAGNVPLIVKETLPKDCTPIVSVPKFTNIDVNTGVLKWISRTGGEMTTFAYLAKAAKQASAFEPLVFDGIVTLRNSGSLTTLISGEKEIVAADFHWADANRDGRISDEEILTVYDRYAALDSLDFDWNEIDDIWSGQGYRWDPLAKKYIIL